MTNPTVISRLEEFAKQNRMRGKGPLSVALVVTNHARTRGLPLDPDELLTARGGQVLGLGKAAVQGILSHHEITRVLAEEGGRTSRGSVGNMRAYVAFLNKLAEKEPVDLMAIEAWWIERVRAHFAAEPFSLHLDPAMSLRAAIHDLLGQAEKRQQEETGTMFVGTVLQHLVGAKLEHWLPGKIEHHGASVKDEAARRAGDFAVGDTAIHVTVAPAEAVIRKCRDNLDKGLRPVIITIGKGVLVAEGLAEQAGIGDRIDVFDAEQFLAGNIYELGRFQSTGRRDSAHKLVDKYNEIVALHETDTSLRIEVGM